MEAEQASKIMFFFSKKLRWWTKVIVSVGLYSKEHQTYKNLNMEVDWMIDLMLGSRPYKGPNAPRP